MKNLIQEIYGLVRSLKTWTRLARIPFLTGTMIPVVLGTIIAWSRYGAFNPVYFVLAMAGAASLHMGTNIINDYFDYRSGCDAVNVESLSPISGGSHVLLENLIRPRKAYFAALLLFAVATVIGVILSAVVGWGLFVLGVMGVVFGYFYVTQLATRGIGELIVGLSFGPLMVLGSYYVQIQSFGPEPLIASLPVGFLITAILWINEIPDYAADKSVGKKTLVVRTGRKVAANLFVIIVTAAFVWILVTVVLRLMPLASLVTLCTLPLAFKATTVARNQYDAPRKMIDANLSTIKLHLLFGVLLVIGYVVAHFVEFLD